MKTHLQLLIVALFSAVIVPSFAMDTPARIHELANGELKNLASTPVIVAAVVAQNALGMSLDEIKLKDQKWMATPGVADYMQALVDSPAGKELARWRHDRPWLSEVFVMDNQGANVAMTGKTSDYWQGDEAKFTDVVKDGGKVFVDRVKFDDSTQTYSVQVSVPIIRDGVVIGAICFGIDVEQI